LSAQVPRKRKSAVQPSGKTVKASILVGVELHARWSAAASLQGMDRSAFAVEAIESACKGVCVVIDRRKPADRAKGEDRPSHGLGISSDEEEAA
jgi:hypothetical protein